MRHNAGRMADPVPELAVASLASTDRLVSLPALKLVDARTGQPPRLATALRIGRRGDALCVRFDARDDGTGVVATHRERDAPLWEEDVCEVFLAPEEDSPRRYFEFEVNPLGTLFDARVDSPELARASMRVDTSWDCPGLSARVTVRPGRWSAALTIPLAALCDGPIPAIWRANFYRIDRGASEQPDEFSAWSPTLADPADFHVPERFGILRLA
jgi:Carbohydrate-binding family 9